MARSKPKYLTIKQRFALCKLLEEKYVELDFTDEKFGVWAAKEMGLPEAIGQSVVSHTRQELGIQPSSHARGFGGGRPKQANKEMQALAALVAEHARDILTLKDRVQELESVKFRIVGGMVKASPGPNAEFHG